MKDPVSILQQYWKHSQFRPMQREIVDAVLAGNDTLALLPTGGGKSVCFQVPGLILDGLCLVVSPLIALMKDQVEQLRQKEIIAYAVYSGMNRREIDILLDNCVYGPVKFLYVSPERLQTELFLERFGKMKVGLIAVDEAHCISQWGYDFRPPYLEIARLREMKPGIPVVALTASATAQVQDDIREKLAFRSGGQVFRRSFARDNLSFVVRKCENKDKKLLEALARVPGTAIIYVRSRKATQEVAAWLTRRNISAAYYHAGLSMEERARRQEDWIQNKVRVMVSTNAFGMGIDKPDVRLVIHLDLPENVESYYQEAGRGGRDGKRSYALILYQEADILTLRHKTEQAHPEPDVLRRTYQALANYYQLAAGAGEGQSFDFDLNEFCSRYKLNLQETYHALRKLEEEGLVQLNESFYSPSHLYFLLDKARLYEFQVANAAFDPMIKMLLRLYGGELYGGFVKISETYLATALSTTPEKVMNQLRHLNQLGVVLYEPVRDKPQLTFVLPRQDAERLPLNLKRLEDRKNLILGKMTAMVNFVVAEKGCRMLLIQQYFDEKSLTPCGICDLCVARRKADNVKDFEGMRIEVMSVVKKNPITLDQLEEIIAPPDQELFVDAVRELVDEGQLEYDKVWRLRIPEQNAG